jgi:hypothetical protein
MNFISWRKINDLSLKFPKFLAGNYFHVAGNEQGNVVAMQGNAMNLVFVRSGHDHLLPVNAG